MCIYKPTSARNAKRNVQFVGELLGFSRRTDCCEARIRIRAKDIRRSEILKRVSIDPRADYREVLLNGASNKIDDFFDIRIAKNFKCNLNFKSH